MIISIDGPAGSGKSSVCKNISQILNFLHINSGNFYRAITYNIIKKNILSEPNKIIDMLSDINIDIDGELIFIDNINTNPYLRIKEVEENVSYVSSIKELRIFINNILKDVAKEEDGIIAEGRDMSTVVFPDANLKIFLTADLEVRAKRRYNQIYQGNVNYDENEFNLIKEKMQKRDEKDTAKEHGGLYAGEDSITLDTSNLNLQEVCEIIIKEYKNKRD